MYFLESSTEGYHGLAQSNRDCMVEKLKAYKYKQEGVDLLMRIANSEPGAGHPTMQGQSVSSYSTVNSNH